MVVSPRVALLFIPWVVLAACDDDHPPPPPEPDGSRRDSGDDSGNGDSGDNDSGGDGGDNDAGDMDGGGTDGGMDGGMPMLPALGFEPYMPPEGMHCHPDLGSGSSVTSTVGEGAGPEGEWGFPHTDGLHGLVSETVYGGASPITHTISMRTDRSPGSIMFVDFRETLAGGQEESWTIAVYYDFEHRPSPGELGRPLAIQYVCDTRPNPDLGTTDVIERFQYTHEMTTFTWIEHRDGGKIVQLWAPEGG